MSGWRVTRAAGCVWPLLVGPPASGPASAADAASRTAALAMQRIERRAADAAEIGNVLEVERQALALARLAARHPVGGKAGVRPDCAAAIRHLGAIVEHLSKQSDDKSRVVFWDELRRYRETAPRCEQEAGIGPPGEPHFR